MKDILALSPWLLGIWAKMLGDQSNCYKTMAMDIGLLPLSSQKIKTMAKDVFEKKVRK